MDIASTLDSKLKDEVEIKSMVVEGNNGAIALAHKSGTTSRTKHIHTKHWFFKEHIGEGSGIKLVKTDTEQQLADIFTKGVEEKLFVLLRNRVMKLSGQWFVCV